MSIDNLQLLVKKRSHSQYPKSAPHIPKTAIPTERFAIAPPHPHIPKTAIAHPPHPQKRSHSPYILKKRSLILPNHPQIQNKTL